MLQNTNYFWRAHLERPIWETILRTRGPSGVNRRSVGRPYQMNFRNLESSLGQLSKFGELIVKALQIETLKLISWSLLGICRESVRWPQESGRNLSGICQESIRSPAQSIETLSGVPQESIGNPSGSYQGVNIFSQVSYTPSGGLSEGLSGAPSEAPFGCPSGVCWGCHTLLQIDGFCSKNPWWF